MQGKGTKGAASGLSEKGKRHLRDHLYYVAVTRGEKDGAPWPALLFPSFDEMMDENSPLHPLPKSMLDFDTMLDFDSMLRLADNFVQGCKDGKETFAEFAILLGSTPRKGILDPTVLAPLFLKGGYFAKVYKDDEAFMAALNEAYALGK
jgi:hypothetical protein